MRATTLQVSWHAQQPVYSVDVAAADAAEAAAPASSSPSVRRLMLRLATAGADGAVRIWLLDPARCEPAPQHEQHGQQAHQRQASAGRTKRSGTQVQTGRDEVSGSVEHRATLTQHTGAVNCVRFNPKSGLLASAGDDGCIVIWKQGDPANMKKSFGTEDEEISKEYWFAATVMRAASMQEIYDICWSPDGQQILCGSLDNCARVWDATTGKCLQAISDHDHYVQGVAWDPLNSYLATESCDRSLAVCEWSQKSTTSKTKIRHRRMEIPGASEDPTSTKKTLPLFLDENMGSFFRRPSFSPAGEILVAPAGISADDGEVTNALYIFQRKGGFRIPAACLPGHKKPVVAVSFNPLAYKLRKSETEKGWISLPFAYYFAVATMDSIVLYSTQRPLPVAVLNNFHYAPLTDIRWSHDGRNILVSSIDGFCSIISFDEGELGDQVGILDPEEITNGEQVAKEASEGQAMDLS